MDRREAVTLAGLLTFGTLGVLAGIVAVFVGWQRGDLTLEGQLSSDEGTILGAQTIAGPTPGATDVARAFGQIHGLVTHPSGTVPLDLVVCAESTLTSERVCESIGGQTSYDLRVPVGEYHVWSYRTVEPGQRGRYTQLSTGLTQSADPATHQSVIVSVGAGQVVTGVSPNDWSVGIE